MVMFFLSHFAAASLCKSYQAAFFVSWETAWWTSYWIYWTFLIYFSLSSSLFPYLLSPGVRTSAWPLRTQRPGETWMTPTPHPLWAPRDRPVGDTSPRVETTPVNSVRASAGLLHPLSSSFIPMLWLSCDLLWGLVHSRVVGGYEPCSLH